MNKKTLLITGAGKGLGQAVSHHFHEMGWFVIATDIRQELLESYHGVDRFLPILMDVSSETSVNQAFTEIKETAASIDLIINNAGIDLYFPLSEAPVEHFKKIFEVNVFGAYRVNQVFLPLLKKPGGGILAIGSESLHITMPFLSYPITKRALENYTLALRQELWFSGCWATVVRCGPIRTSILENVSHLKSEVEGTRLDPVFKRFAAAAPKEAGNPMEPAQIAEILYKIISKPRPKAIYRINNRFALRMLKWLPFGVVEQVVRKKLKG